MELMIAMLAVAKLGKAFLTHAAHTIMAIENMDRAMNMMTLVINHTSLWTVVSSNFVCPDIETMRPMIDLSPVAKTTPVPVPWTTNVEVKARFRVSSGFSEVDSTTPGMWSLQS
jgi:hypothetical protein